MRVLGSFLCPRQKRDVDCFLNIVKYPIPVKLNSIISGKWLSSINILVSILLQNYII